MRTLTSLFLASLLGLTALSASGKEPPTLRKTLAQRLPELQKIDEIRPTPIPGLFELRIGTDLLYATARGEHVIKGEIYDTTAQRNLTAERVGKLTAMDFSALPLKDAFTIVRGEGKRQLAVFEDPNCGYCKRLERDLQSVDNITLHIFLMPILGADSVEKSRNIWCAPDRAAAWQDYMLRNKSAPAASCDTSALDRNVALGRKHKITGTPTLVFVDGSRVPGAMALADLERRLNGSQNP